MRNSELRRSLISPHLSYIYKENLDSYLGCYLSGSHVEIH